MFTSGRRISSKDSRSNGAIMEAMEGRVLFSSISTLAVPYLNRQIIANEKAFYVYKDGDSGLNHGYPSGFFANPTSLTTQIGVNASAIYSAASPTGVTNDPNALDTTHGDVLQVVFPALSAGQFVGVNIEEPENDGADPRGAGDDLTGATNVVFDAASPTQGVFNVQFGVGGKVSGFYTLTDAFQTISIPLNTLQDHNSHLVSPPDLSDVHLLFAVDTNVDNAPNGGTVLLDNIRFRPVPVRQATEPTLPLDTQTFGVVPVAAAGAPVPPDEANRNIASIYASSIAEISLLEQGTLSSLSNAKEIADAFVYALAHDNQGDLISPTGGPTALHNAYSSGDLTLLNNQQAPAAGLAGQVRLAGFSGPTDLPYKFYVELDGATGGNNAFAMLALMAAYKKFGTASYLNAAKEIGTWIVSTLTDTSGTGYGGYFLGYADATFSKKAVVMGKSTENNADIFAAFTELAGIQSSLGHANQSARWTTRADIAGDFVMAMYDPANGRFNAGTVPTKTPATAGIDPSGPQRGTEVVNVADFLDSNSFTTLALASAARYRNQINWRKPLKYIINHFAETITADGATFQGFDIVSQPTTTPPNVTTPGPNGIAWEFTGQVVETMRFIDALYATTRFNSLADFYLSQIAQAQASAPFANGAGLVAATIETGDQLAPVDQGLTTPFQVIPERIGLPATVWAIMADQQINPLAD